MNPTTEAPAATPPKRAKREKAAIIPLPPPVEIRLGSLSIADPKEMIHRAAQLADALAEIIHQQKLYTVIKGKKHVWVEGWTTMGAMLGVAPIEESCEPTADGKGYKAKVKLVRLFDEHQVGGASAICKTGEKGWADNEDFATHSKAITRATGKAFRLSFAWIMKLAGFEATPAAELFESDGSEEEQDNAERELIEKQLGRKFETLEEARAAAHTEAERLKEEEKAEKRAAKETIFVTWPESHNGHKALFIGQTAARKCGAEPLMQKTGNWSDRDMGWYVKEADVKELVQTLRALGGQVVERENPFDLVPKLEKSIEKAKGAPDAA